MWVYREDTKVEKINPPEEGEETGLCYGYHEDTKDKKEIPPRRGKRPALLWIT